MFSVFFAPHVIGLCPLHPPLPHRLFVPYVPSLSPLSPLSSWFPEREVWFEPILLLPSNGGPPWHEDMMTMTIWGYEDEDMRIWWWWYEDMITWWWSLAWTNTVAALLLHWPSFPSLTLPASTDDDDQLRLSLSLSLVQFLHHQKFDEVIINLGICNEKDASGMDIDIWAKCQRLEILLQLLWSTELAKGGWAPVVWPWCVPTVTIEDEEEGEGLLWS